MSLFDIDALAATVEAGLQIQSPLDHEYSWVVEEDVWRRLGTGFDHTLLKDPDRNIALKEHLAEKWASADSQSKFTLAKWIISDWGKVRGNADETIRRHVRLADAPHPDFPFEGIASYSKVLSIKDPQRFAIFDARVATSLNAIQLIQGKGIFAFPIPPGRNKEIDKAKTKQGFSDIYTRKVLNSRGFAIAPRNATYEFYLTLLQKLNRITGKPILHLEMQLFGRAIEFSQIARQMHPV